MTTTVTQVQTDEVDGNDATTNDNIINYRNGTSTTSTTIANKNAITVMTNKNRNRTDDYPPDMTNYTPWGLQI